MKGVVMGHAEIDSGYEVWFRSLASEGRALGFPCDAQGRVVLDALSERVRNDYLYARALVGWAFGLPEVVLRPGRKT
jgi:hypothetical protein